MVNCVLLNTAPADVYTQMAADDYFVSLNTQECFLRIFNWAGGPSATFGYAQFESSVKKQLQTQGITQYTRRPTGGGVVLHKDDLTFSLIFNSPQLVSPNAIYSALHGCIKEELLKVKQGLSAYGDKSDYRPAHGSTASNCFTNPVSNDILDEGGSKVLGGAIRRFNTRILYQGSLQFNGARGNLAYITAVKAGVLKYLGAAAYIQRAATQEEWQAISSLGEKQYNTREWIEKF